MKPTLFNELCTACGRCIRMMGEYCIAEAEGRPVFDESVCNLCLKCVAICPNGAIGVNGARSEPLSDFEPGDFAALERLFQHRRSTKRFTGEPLERALLERIVAASVFAPNQNKNIRAMIVDDPALIASIDNACLRYVRKWYRVLFGFAPFTAIVRLFYPGIDVIRRKMELDLRIRGRVVKEGTSALVLLTGDKSVAVTEASAQHMIAAVYWAATALGVGSCLMDSVKIAFRIDADLRRRLKLQDGVLTVLALGKSAEHIVNIPKGYEVPIAWNGEGH